jgi:hypothetical protein
VLEIQHKVRYPMYLHSVQCLTDTYPRTARKSLGYRQTHDAVEEPGVKPGQRRRALGISLSSHSVCQRNHQARCQGTEEAEQERNSLVCGYPHRRRHNVIVHCTRPPAPQGVRGEPERHPDRDPLVLRNESGCRSCSPNPLQCLPSPY